MFHFRGVRLKGGAAIAPFLFIFPGLTKHLYLTRQASEGSSSVWCSHTLPTVSQAL